MVIPRCPIQGNINHTNIPRKETIEIIKRNLNTNTDHKYTGQLVKSIEMILDQNYFCFNNKIYKQQDGYEGNHTYTKFRKTGVLINHKPALCRRNHYIR